MIPWYREEIETKKFLEDLHKVMTEGKFPDYKPEEVTIDGDYIIVRATIRRRVLL